MNSNGSVLIVFCTCPNEEIAKNLATLLVQEDCAACVNIINGITSIYRWCGVIENATEYLLIIKTSFNSYQKLEELIVKNHPYQIPEIIAIPISQGLPNYLKWITELS